VPTSPTGIVLVLHGASEHGGRYDRFARVLGDEGWAVYAPDHRGHGRTAAATGRGIIGPGGIDGVLRDVDGLRALAVDEVGALPVVVFGHSMGSMIALGYVERFGDGLAGCVLSGAAGVAPDGSRELAATVRDMAEGGMAETPVEMLGPFNESFEPARTPYDWLSRDEAEVDAYVADPDCGDELLLTYGYIAELMTVGVEATEEPAIARIPTALPFLLVTGDRDPVSNGGAQVRELEARLRQTGHDVTAHYYAEARHEVLNETNRDDVHRDIVEWLAHRR
jgi:alpha-beta hydrolase superfamily lysophospholipase